MKNSFKLLSATTLALILSACGTGTVSSSGDVPANNSNGVIEGQFVDAPVEGVKYICGDKESLTDENGNFKCEELPIKFMVGKVLLGELKALPEDKIVTPQDLAGVDRDKLDDETVCNIAIFLQSLDDDGDINSTITIDDEIANNFDQNIDIKNLGEKNLKDILEDAGVGFIIPEDKALEHLKEHILKIQKHHNRDNNDSYQDQDDDLYGDDSDENIKEFTPKRPTTPRDTTNENPFGDNTHIKKDNIDEDGKIKGFTPKRPTSPRDTTNENPFGDNTHIKKDGNNQDYNDKGTTNRPHKTTTTTTRPIDEQTPPTSIGDDDNEQNIDNQDNTNTKDTSSSKSFRVDTQKGIAINTAIGAVWQNSRIGHGTRDKAVDFCEKLNLAGLSNWRLPTSKESKEFHLLMNRQGDTPKQAFSRCTAEVTKDGYVKTLKGSKQYGGEAGDSINFSGGANIRCVSDSNTEKKTQEGVKPAKNHTSTENSANIDNGDNVNVTPLNEDLRASFLKAINDARATGRQCGQYGYFKAVPPLKWNHNLYVASYRHSYDMAKTNTFSHTGSGKKTDLVATAYHAGEGSTMKERIDYAQYKNWRKIGENIAAGTNMKSPAQAVEGWIKSPPHCKNLMSPDFTEVGLAVAYDGNSHYKYYWTQDFGKRK